MVDPIYKMREDFLMDNPDDEMERYERKAINKKMFNILQNKKQLRDLREGYFIDDAIIPSGPSRVPRQNYRSDNVMRRKIRKTLKNREEIMEEPEFKEEEGGYFEDDRMRKEIRKILDHRIKSGAGYYDSLLNNKYGLKARKYMKKRKARDPLGEYHRRMVGGRKASKKNKWIKFLAEFRKANPQLQGREVMKYASMSYKKQKNL